ncbi:hypothetical protein [Streptomyces massasporeus]|uniref:hypothetical protein n=1 Tax=Streptomyces massasporeus TaxID=67324 RepID=UPI0033C73627
MTAVDQGIAGLAGAIAGGLIGIVGTLGAARVTGRAQEQTQRAQWRRQVRRDAYSQFISRASQAIAAAEAAHQAARDDTPEAAESYKALAKAQAALEEAYVLVQLEGPAQAAEAADEAHSEVLGWKINIGWLLEESPRVGRDRALREAAGASLLAVDRLHDFTEVCRELLDEDEKPGRPRRSGAGR